MELPFKISSTFWIDNFLRCTSVAGSLSVLLVFRKSSRLQREGKASSGKQQAGAAHCSVISLQRALNLWVCSTSKLTKTVSVGAPDVPDEVEGSSTPKRSRFNLQSREVEEEEEEDRSVRRSSRITTYKLNSRNQSVLYDRLITKWVHCFRSK